MIEKLKKLKLEVLVVSNIIIIFVLWIGIFIEKSFVTNPSYIIIPLNLLISIIILPISIGLITMKYFELFIGKFIKNKLVETIGRLLAGLVIMYLAAIISFVIFSTILIFTFPN